MLEFAHLLADFFALRDEPRELLLHTSELAPLAVAADGEVDERHGGDDADRAAEEHEDVEPGQMHGRRDRSERGSKAQKTALSAQNAVCPYVR